MDRMSKTNHPFIKEIIILNRATPKNQVWYGLSRTVYTIYTSTSGIWE